MTDKATHTPLPCPFCSGDAIIIHEDRVWIECADCPSKAEVGPFDTEAEALTAWNTRAVNSHHRLVEALEEARTELSITRTNIMCEINRCADPRDIRWEGVPEILKERIAKIDAALKEAGRG